MFSLQSFWQFKTAFAHQRYVNLVFELHDGVLLGLLLNYWFWLADLYLMPLCNQLIVYLKIYILNFAFLVDKFVSISELLGR